jgi:molybdopterin molybdotransferase
MTITPAQASDTIRNSLPAFATETVSVSEACGRVLRQPVVAERDQPPFDRVMMDGIALRFDAWRNGLRKFRIQGTQHAGDPVQTLSDEGDCIEIMTGAMLPRKSDCVIPVERIAVDGDSATVEKDYVALPRQFIHPQGSDYREGQKLLDSGNAISPMDIAIIASCGLSEVAVSSRPVIRVISTGNELVPAGAAIAAQQVRLSNGPALLAMLARQGYTDCKQDHIADEPALLHERLAQHLDEAAILILSGGVSMGKADYVPGVLANLGVRQVFHGVRQRPGKPMWFGIGSRGQAVFALPGNPVSTLVCCRQYVLTALHAASGRAAAPLRYAVLSAEFTFEPKLTCFLPVRISSRDDGVVMATPAPTNTSGDFTALSGTDGYVELAQELSDFPAGIPVPLHFWDRP